MKAAEGWEGGHALYLQLELFVGLIHSLNDDILRG